MQTNQNECQCKFKTVIIIGLPVIETTGESWNGNRTLYKGEMVDEGTLSMETNFNIPSTVIAL